jgi:hypothetical protein
MAFSQAHIIQSNLLNVTMLFFTFEDDLGRECTHQSSFLCPFPMAAHLTKLKGNPPPKLNIKLCSRRRD